MKEYFGEVISLVDVVLDGAFEGVEEEEVVVGDGVERFSLSLVRSTNSCFGGMIVSLIFLNPGKKRLVYPWKFEVKENVSGEEIEKSS
ncbi:hypothetical protein Tco_0383302 [Tanacetum coccineum]